MEGRTLLDSGASSCQPKVYCTLDPSLLVNPNFCGPLAQLRDCRRLDCSIQVGVDPLFEGSRPMKAINRRRTARKLVFPLLDKV